MEIKREDRMKHRHGSPLWEWTLGIILFPCAAQAEVMDKELSLTTLWIWCFAGIIIALACPKKYWWMAVAAFPVIAIVFYVALTEVYDPFVGPAIAHETGNAYMVSAHAAPLLVLAAYICAFRKYK